MKNTKNIIFVVIILLVVVGQIGYFVTEYSEDKQRIQDTSSELESTERYLKQLQERVAMLPETKKELELMTTQKTALLNTIPLFESDSRQDAEFMRYVSLKDFIDVDWHQTNGDEQVVDESIHTSNYEVSFIGRYKDVRDFVDSLNGSYQVINVTEFTIDNSIQEEAKVEEQSEAGKKEKNRIKDHFGDDVSQVVNANIKFKIYSRVNDEEIDEIYTPEYSMQVNSEGVFERIDKKDIKDESSDDEVSPTVDGSEGDKQEDDKQESTNVASGKFTLNIGDIFTSGDTYKLGGPGEDGYVGLVSQVNTEIQLTVSSTGYQMYIKDANGQEKHAKVNMPIQNAKLDIVSTMRQIDDVMPSIHVYVYNYTPNIMDVDIAGSMLDNIHIFNEQGKEVQIGQTKGNIRVS